MKLFAFAGLLLFCLITMASADWQQSLKQEYHKKVSSAITSGMNSLMQTAGMINTPTAWACFNRANSQLMSILHGVPTAFDECINSNSNLMDARRCCENKNNSIMVKVLSISSAASGCMH